MNIETNQLSVGFISLGCAKNLVDTEIIAESILSRDFVLSAIPEQADIIIINTCSFIADAKEESIQKILEACELKKRGLCKIIMVTGCLAQRYRKELPQLLPEVDIFIGLDEIADAGNILQSFIKTNKRIIKISENASQIIEPAPDRIIFTGMPYAYVKISDGCDHSCSFCAIPQIRGKYRSRRIEKITSEVEHLLSTGIKEINLVSQDVTSYGKDLPDKNTLSELLEQLGRIGGQFWIRLLYGHPRLITPKLLETIARIPQVCNYLDLPIQHASSHILKLMRRGYDKEFLYTLFNKIREIIPDIALRTTCITGFPEETDEDFRKLVDFIQEIQFDHLGIFRYSNEENTPAFNFKNIPEKRTVEKRIQYIQELQTSIIQQKHKKMIGGNAVLLIQQKNGQKKNQFLARSRYQAPEVDNATILEANENIYKIGMFINTKFTGAANSMLKAGPNIKQTV
jgi:ribosomal protein S12 methylthiotransferase